jgi:hypothetical protein
MKQVFDLIETINETALQFREQTGYAPSSIAVSPRSYRRLLEIKAWEQRIGNLVIGCTPLREMETPFGKVNIVINETSSDTAVEAK